MWAFGFSGYQGVHVRWLHPLWISQWVVELHPIAGPPAVAPGSHSQ